jgi:Xaa-Pro dipeptidase
MQGNLVFAEQEYARRLAAVRGRMAKRDLALCLIATPENIYYLTGLDHWGYFAPHILVVPVDGEMVLVTRAMERVTVARQVRNATFMGYEDHETAAHATIRLLHDRGYGKAQGSERKTIGIEKWSSCFPLGLAEILITALPDINWVDITDLVDELREVKSPAELECVRAAAAVSDAAMLAAIETVRVGASERAVAAACHSAMIQSGGTFPGFGPFIRSTTRLGEEHTSWGEGVLSEGDTLFIELSGCVNRYHAPTGRLIFVGSAPTSAIEMAKVCIEAFDAAVEALRPGLRAGDAYQAWQGIVDRAGLSDYRRHHCGYLIGVGFPPSWTGGNRVTGLRHDSELEIRTGMTFHVLSWLMGTGRGDYFVSDTVLLGEDGPELLTRTPRDVLVK